MFIDLNPEVKYEDDYIRIEHDPQVHFLHVVWKKTPDSETFRRLFRLAADMVFEYKCLYWLSDARTIPYIDFADQNWVLRDMTPLLVASPLKKYARLSTKDSLGLLDIHRISSNLSPDASARFESFTNLDAAYEWLFSDFETSFSPN